MNINPINETTISVKRGPVTSTIGMEQNNNFRTMLIFFGKIILLNKFFCKKKNIH